MMTLNIAIDGTRVEVAAHPTHDCYAAGRDGDVYRRPIIRAPGIPRGGPRPRADFWERIAPFPAKARYTPTYLKFRLTQDGTSKLVSVHRFILECWVGVRPRSEVTRHLNDDSMDNRLENLAYGTVLQNSRDAFRNNGNYAEGERNGRAKLTEEDVRRIRRLHREGRAIPDIQRTLFPDCNVQTIRYAANGETWRHLL